jgi:hypothetical protein
MNDIFKDKTFKSFQSTLDADQIVRLTGPKALSDIGLYFEKQEQNILAPLKEKNTVIKKLVELVEIERNMDALHYAMNTLYGDSVILQKNELLNNNNKYNQVKELLYTQEYFYIFRALSDLNRTLSSEIRKFYNYILHLSLEDKKNKLVENSTTLTNFEDYFTTTIDHLNLLNHMIDHIKSQKLPYNIEKEMDEKAKQSQHSLAKLNNLIEKINFLKDQIDNAIIKDSKIKSILGNVSGGLIAIADVISGKKLSKFRASSRKLETGQAKYDSYVNSANNILGILKDKTDNALN